MLQFIRRILLSDFGSSPVPDVNILPSYKNENIVEILYSDSKNIRSIITKDENQIYRIYKEFWDVSDWNRWGKAFWVGRGSGTFSDNLIRAREIAREVVGFSQKTPNKAEDPTPPK